MNSSREEVNALLQAEDFENYMGKMSETWRRLAIKLSTKQRLNSKEKSAILDLNNLLFAIARKACPDVFREHVEQSVVKAWLGYAIAHIKQCTTNRNWIATGKLQPHETSLLDVCAAMVFRDVPVTEAFDSEFFHVLADFVKARKGTGRLLPCPSICHTIAEITCIAYLTIRGSRRDNPWTAYKALMKLESTGILEQYVRCATVPQPNNIGGALLHLLDEIQLCGRFFGKKVQPGKPIGDVIIAIVEGRDGSRVERPNVLTKLKRMVRISDSIQLVGGHQSCRNCGISNLAESRIVSLLSCARCHLACYCSKECQKADWRTHKPLCSKTTEKRVCGAKIMNCLTGDIVQRHYVHIMVKMAKACQQTGLPVSDMVVGLDFDANKDTIVPAMQDPPEFKVVPVKNCTEGLLRNKGLKIEQCLGAIKASHDKLQPNEILCSAKHRRGFGFVCSIVTGRVDPVTKKEAFSQEAVLAFQSYVNDHDDGALAEIFEPQFLAKLKWDLAIHYGEGALDE